MRRVLITGASSGIGLQLAQDYAAQGWQVVACGRNQEKLQSALADYKVECCVFDTTDRAACNTALTAIEPVDLAILGAGTCE
jgi:NADP-dependent 3-hydroxy acid dehydrogenase YdfG